MTTQMQKRLGELAKSCGVPAASPFTRAVFDRFAAEPAEHFEATLADLSALRPALLAAPYRYCDTLADELVRELRRLCGAEATPQKIAEAVGGRAGVEQLAFALLERLTAAIRTQPKFQTPFHFRVIADLCAFLSSDDNTGGGDPVAVA